MPSRAPGLPPACLLHRARVSLCHRSHLSVCAALNCFISPSLFPPRIAPCRCPVRCLMMTCGRHISIDFGPLPILECPSQCVACTSGPYTSCSRLVLYEFCTFCMFSRFVSLRHLLTLCCYLSQSIRFGFVPSPMLCFIRDLPWHARSEPPGRPSRSFLWLAAGAEDPPSQAAPGCDCPH